MSNGHARTNCVVVMASNGIPFLLTNVLHYENLFSHENNTISKRNSTVFSQNGSRCCQQRLRVSYHWQPQRFLVEATMKTCATVIPVPLKRTLPLGPVAVEAHLWIIQTFADDLLLWIVTTHRGGCPP